MKFCDLKPDQNSMTIRTHLNTCYHGHSYF